MAAARVALVTGANRGIGLEITRQLLKKFNGVVLLAARSSESGKEAIVQLESEGLSPKFLQLDVSSKESIESAKKVVNDQYGRIDVLVNNAGIMMKVNETDLAERAKQTINVNFFGTYNMIEVFWSLLQPNSRIVNLSSGLGNISYLGAEWRAKISAPDLTITQLVQYMEQYIKDASSSAIAEWHANMPGYSDCYSVSKIGVNRLTTLLAKRLQSDGDSPPGVLVNSVCPGWVRTDMGGDSASRSVEQGADTPVYLSLLPVGTTQPQGAFLRDKKILEGY